MKKILVIGYGNRLRGDDGAGILAAELIASRHPDIDCMTVHGLSPELAETISGYTDVFFLDAAVDLPAPAVTSIAIPQAPAGGGSHASSPQEVLALCDALYATHPARAILVRIPMQSSDFSEQCTPFTQQGIAESVGLVEGLLYN